MFRLFLVMVNLQLLHTAVFSQNVGINTTGEAPHEKALLDIDASGSETKGGLLVPRLSTEERNTITAPIPESLLIYNTTIRCFEAYDADNELWVSFGCLSCIPPNSPVEQDHSSSETEITWNWAAVVGADGYKFNIDNDYSGATDTQGDLTFTQTGLFCNTDYTLYIWAYNNCSVSAVSTLTESSSACPQPPCGSDLVIHHIAGDVAPVTKTVTYGTVSTSAGGTGEKCWITKNLGASQQATSYDDNTEESAGWYWQFNRRQGYKYTLDRTPNTTWVIDFSESSDWLPANDPCTIELGEGWRIPTQTEWTNIDAAFAWNNEIDVFASILKLHDAGTLGGEQGFVINRGQHGFYWSTMQFEFSEAYGLVFSDAYSLVNNLSDKGAAHTLRCLRD